MPPFQLPGEGEMNAPRTGTHAGVSPHGGGGRSRAAAPWCLGVSSRAIVAVTFSTAIKRDPFSPQTDKV